MMDMPRPRPHGLHKETTRHGKTVWYLRPSRGRRVRIRAEFGTPEFQEEYNAALSGAPASRRSRHGSASLVWLIERYQDSSAWGALSEYTRKHRGYLIKRILQSAGTKPYGQITRKTIIEGIERRKNTPAQARAFLKVMRGLFKWAKSSELVRENPCDNIDPIQQRKTGGIPVWTEEELQRFERHWPVGTRERLWFDILLYTGLRRGDAVGFGRQHIKNGIATIQTEKSKGQISVTFPILPALARSLKAGPCGDLVFVAGYSGQKITKQVFGAHFSNACRAAGIKKSAHGLRKAGATRAAENGATVAELEAMFGWTGGQMASLYTRSANRAALSTGAFHKMQRNETGASIPAPMDKVRDGRRKTK